jgi:hypothetical protein
MAPYWTEEAGAVREIRPRYIVANLGLLVYEGRSTVVSLETVATRSCTEKLLLSLNPCDSISTCPSGVRLWVGGDVVEQWLYVT